MVKKARAARSHALPPTTVWILEDQLTLDHPALSAGSSHLVVLLVESRAWAEALPHHKQKLVFVWSAMRHFADELRSRGFVVDYHEATDDYAPALRQHLRHHRPGRVVVMESAELGVSATHAATLDALGVQHEILPNTMFVSSRDEFRRWVEGRRQPRLESFYRTMRKKTGLLMEADEPVGGQWNYDRQNRRRPDPGHEFPEIPRFSPDKTTREVMAWVDASYPEHFGDIDGFAWPVTRADAEALRDDFIENRLLHFGDYQDAIVCGEPSLYHSLLSPALNVGLLEPLDLCRRVEDAYQDGRAPINSAEGFIRQVVGWREYVYQVYHWKMPAYRTENALGANRALPDFYWSGETSMRCVADAVTMLRRHGINHHIQRLMVTGNFALLAGIDPAAVNRWYWLAYVDAWEWVVTPNVLGMALHADGGVLASKPYAASANYLNTMSDCCAACQYDPKQATGQDSCPFNSLYWDFLARHRKRFAKNARMRLMLSNLDKKPKSELNAVRRRARSVLRDL